MSESLHSDQLNLLVRALRQKSFHFIIIGYDHPDIFPEISAWLHEHLPDRPIRELPVSDKTFQEIQNILIQAYHDIVLIPDFDWFFKPENASISVAFNQHRDFFARRKMTLLCFIQSLNFRLLPLKMPDLWSLRSLELEFKGTVQRSTYNLSNIDDTESALLSVFSVLPAEPITRTILKELLPNVNNLDATLQSLVNKGLIAFDEKDDSFTCDSELQETTRNQNRDQLYEHCKLLISTLIEKLESQPDNTRHFLNATYKEALIYAKYAENILQHINKAEQNLAILVDRVGNFHTITGNFDTALTFYEQYHQLTKELCGAVPDNVSFKDGLAISYEKLGQTHDELGNLDKALTFYEQFRQLTKELYDAFPSNVSFKDGLAISYQFLGDTHSKLGNLDKALTFYEDETRLFEELYDAFPSNVSFKNGLAISYEKLGETHAQLGNLDKALTFYEQYRQLTKELYDAFPSNVSFKNGLAVSYYKLGSFYKDHRPDIVATHNYFQQTEALWAELTESAPGYAKFQHYLIQVRKDLSELPQS